MTNFTFPAVTPVDVTCSILYWAWSEGKRAAVIERLCTTIVNCIVSGFNRESEGVGVGAGLGTGLCGRPVPLSGSSRPTRDVVLLTRNS